MRIDSITVARTRARQARRSQPVKQEFTLVLDTDRFAVSLSRGRRYNSGGGVGWGHLIRGSDYAGPAGRSRQRRGLLRARTFGAAQRRAGGQRLPTNRFTNAFAALLGIGATSLLGVMMVSSLVSASTGHLTLAASSLPGLPAAATESAAPPSIAAAMQTHPAMTSQPLVRTEVTAAPTTAAALAAEAEATPPMLAPSATAPADAAASLTATATTAGTPPGAATPGASEQRVAALTSDDSEDERDDTPSAPFEPPALYQPYEVQAGDTVSGIAARFGVRSEDIIANNSGVISDQSLLVVGASLQVPAAPGVLHNIQVGETLTDIAQLYGVTLEDIVGYAGNRISDPGNVPVGTQILVVHGSAPAPVIEEPAVEETVPTPEPTVEPTIEPTPEPTPTPIPSPTFIWPVQGRITSYFGPSHPKGIDISIAYAPVAASAAGRVVFVGGDACCSYGYYIDIEHADGYMTRYAHLSKFLVTLGQQVAQGDTIAISGNTGYSTGAHVHFELRKGGDVRNPLDFLP